MKIQEILNDWEKGLTHGEIKEKHKLSSEAELAITEYSAGLSIEEIKERIAHLKSGMKAFMIKTVMEDNQILT